MRVYMGASYKLSKDLRIGAGLPIQINPDAFKHFAATIAWLYLLGAVLQLLVVKP